MLRGKYTPLRIWQTLLVIFVLAAMIGSMVSGIILSRYVLSFLPISGGRSFGRSLHMLASYWGFVLMALFCNYGSFCVYRSLSCGNFETLRSKKEARLK